MDDRVSHDRPLRSGQVTVMSIGGHGIGHGHRVYDRVIPSRVMPLLPCIKVSPVPDLMPTCNRTFVGRF